VITPRGLHPGTAWHHPRDLWHHSLGDRAGSARYETTPHYGGGLNEGLQKEMKADPNLQRRLNVFLQTRGNVVNLQSFGGTMASNYSAHLIQALLDPSVRTFGAAARRADRETKQYMPTDAEAIIGGIHIGRLEQESRGNAAA
jgi:hypothetical protein